MAVVVGLFLFYLVVTGGLPQFLAFATQTQSGSSSTAQTGNGLPSLNTLPSLAPSQAGGSTSQAPVGTTG